MQRRHVHTELGAIHAAVLQILLILLHRIHLAVFGDSSGFYRYGARAGADIPYNAVGMQAKLRQCQHPDLPLRNKPLIRLALGKFLIGYAQRPAPLRLGIPL
ncbi:hypothetical protein D3C85_1634240 [compost metagenome]